MVVCVLFLIIDFFIVVLILILILVFVLILLIVFIAFIDHLRLMLHLHLLLHGLLLVFIHLVEFLAFIFILFLALSHLIIVFLVEVFLDLVSSTLHHLIWVHTIGHHHAIGLVHHLTGAAFLHQGLATILSWEVGGGNVETIIVFS